MFSDIVKGAVSITDYFTPVQGSISPQELRIRWILASDSGSIPTAALPCTYDISSCRKVRTFGRNPNGKVAFVDLPSTAAAEDEKCLSQNRPAFSVAPTKRPTRPGEQR